MRYMTSIEVLRALLGPKTVGTKEREASPDIELEQSKIERWSLHQIQYFVELASPLATKLYNQTFGTKIEDMTREQLEKGWNTTQAIFRDLLVAVQAKSVADLNAEFANLSYDSIARMVEAADPNGSDFLTALDIHSVMWTQFRDGLPDIHHQPEGWDRDRHIAQGGLPEMWSPSLHKAIAFLARGDPAATKMVVLVGLPMFREFVLSDSDWDLRSPDMFGRPEVLLFLLKALSTLRYPLFPQELGDDPITFEEALLFLPKHVPTPASQPGTMSDKPTESEAGTESTDSVSDS